MSLEFAKLRELLAPAFANINIEAPLSKQVVQDLAKIVPTLLSYSDVLSNAELELAGRQFVIYVPEQIFLIRYVAAKQPYMTVSFPWLHFLEHDLALLLNLDKLRNVEKGTPMLLDYILFHWVPSEYSRVWELMEKLLGYPSSNIRRLLDLVLDISNLLEAMPILETFDVAYTNPRTKQYIYIPSEKSVLNSATPFRRCFPEHELVLITDREGETLAYLPEKNIVLELGSENGESTVSAYLVDFDFSKYLTNEFDKLLREENVPPEEVEEVLDELWVKLLKAGHEHPIENLELGSIVRDIEKLLQLY